MKIEKPPKQKNTYFAIAGHINKAQPPPEKLKKLLSILNLEMKVWRFQRQPIFFTNEDPRRPPDE